MNIHKLFSNKSLSKLIDDIDNDELILSFSLPRKPFRSHIKKEETKFHKLNRKSIQKIRNLVSHS